MFDLWRKTRRRVEGSRRERACSMAAVNSTRSHEPRGRIGARIVWLLRSRKWLLGWFAFYLWIALFLGLWHLAPACPRATLRAGNNIRLHAFSADSKTLTLSTSVDRNDEDSQFVQVWDVDNQRLRFDLEIGPCVMQHAIFSPDGSLLAAQRKDGRLTLWDLTTGKERVDYYPELGLHGYWECFSPDSRFVVYLSRPDADHQSFLCLDLAARVPNPQFVSGFERARHFYDDKWIAFAPDGKTFALAQHDPECATTIERWRVGDPGQPFTLEKSLTMELSQIVISPNLDICASVVRSDEADGVAEIKVWDIATGEVKCKFSQKTHNCESKLHLQFSRDERSLFVCDLPPRSFVFVSGGGNTLPPNLPFFDRSNITRLDFETGRSISTEIAVPVNLLASRDDRWTLIVGNNGADVMETASLWKHGELRVAGDHSLPPPEGLSGPDGKTVVITRIMTIPQPDRMTAWLCEFGFAKPQADFVVVARLWNVEQCKELACFENCNQVLYSPDGKILATVHDDGTVRLWDVPPRKPVLAILGVSLVLWFGLAVGVQLWIRVLRRGRRGICPPRADS
jgi:WD40 repeat protein